MIYPNRFKLQWQGSDLHLCELWLLLLQEKCFGHICAAPKRVLEGISAKPQVWAPFTTGSRLHTRITNQSPPLCCMASHPPGCCCCCSLLKLHSESPREALMEVTVSIFCGSSDSLCGRSAPDSVVTGHTDVDLSVTPSSSVPVCSMARCLLVCVRSLSLVSSGVVFFLFFMLLLINMPLLLCFLSDSFPHVVSPLLCSHLCCKII